MFKNVTDKVKSATQIGLDSAKSVTQIGQKAIDTAKNTTQMGQETRLQILPTMNIDDSGYKQPIYDFADAVPRPAQVGVRRGGGFGDVIDAAKGVAYYVDVVGFGQSSSPLTKGMQFSPLGINFFMPSGLVCSNGANMWTYVEGIPRGDALGATIQKAMNEIELPDLKGLAPGIVEDAKQALNPKPLFQAAFGNVYPVCKKVSLPVGDAKGNLMNPEAEKDPKTNKPSNPDDIWIDEKMIQFINGRPHQEKWVQATDQKGNPVFITQDEWENTPKTMNLNGTPIKKEGFEDMQKVSVLTAVVLGFVAFAVFYGRK